MGCRHEDEQGLIDGSTNRMVDDWLDGLLRAATVEKETVQWLRKGEAMPNIYPTHPEVRAERMQALADAQEKLHEGRRIFSAMAGSCGDLCKNVMLEHYIAADSWKQIGIRNTLSRTSVWRLQKEAKSWLAQNLEGLIGKDECHAGDR